MNRSLEKFLVLFFVVISTGLPVGIMTNNYGMILGITAMLIVLAFLYFWVDGDKHP